jgi:hypothetical protein
MPSWDATSFASNLLLFSLQLYHSFCSPLFFLLSVKQAVYIAQTIAKTNMLLNEGVVEMGGSGYVNADKLADLSNRPDSRGRLTDSLAELADLAKTLPNHFDNPAKRIPASTPKPGMIEAMALSQGPQGVPVATAGLIRKQTGPRIAPQVTYPEYQKKLIESMNYRINPPEQNAHLIQNLLRYGALQPNR